MFARFTDALRGARKSELLLILALLCAVTLIMYAPRTDSGVVTGIERRMEHMLKKINGAGDVQVMITQNTSGETTGVLVVAEGASDIKVKLDILNAVKTLLCIDADKIEIIRMRGNAD